MAIQHKGKSRGESRPPVSQDKLLSLYYTMLLIRRFEEKVHQLFLKGEMSGTIHQYLGQEAIAVGVCANLRKEDWITSTHRPHGHALAKGLSVRSLFCELLGKAEGCCGGKGGSMHLGDPEVGMLPAIAIVGGGLPLAAGLALAFSYQGTDQVAVAFFGEGATGEGAFHEALNLASLKKLPLILVCENNLYAASTPFALGSPVQRVAERACAYGLPGETIEGNDVLSVYQASQRAIKRARGGEGPTLLECLTYRFCGHSRSDPAHYRPKEELEAWKKKDPLLLFQNHLLKQKIATQKELEVTEEKIQEELKEAWAYAQAAPLAPLKSAWEDVYA
ncbi:pyruvate dehydrogenase E1 component alpha subunit [Candidatus Hakubella thermalkaliphila]|uniref:Pyruvate dehydrogenase E1 component alpha subunit n=1 Tax=Candidatus Hakubella thermalkaliphila TaxID=2754717 RepID=A0A6V8NRY9_9ACTN|nr:thiamine pyrophosphate-dependent dehydrogenase E1 component subunit alpha [Candidatus Hakubella thermalkaliphila]GFP22031.1 pyruvate dehydrogenase E1 component alpha subunit [Candidatus Hakubella thermalkaliphila]